jgi:hypothetical protein
MTFKSLIKLKTFAKMKASQRKEKKLKEGECTKKNFLCLDMVLLKMKEIQFSLYPDCF